LRDQAGESPPSPWALSSRPRGGRCGLDPLAVSVLVWAVSVGVCVPGRPESWRSSCCHVIGGFDQPILLFFEHMFELSRSPRLADGSSVRPKPDVERTPRPRGQRIVPSRVVVVSERSCRPGNRLSRTAPPSSSAVIRCQTARRPPERLGRARRPTETEPPPGPRRVATNARRSARALSTR
jgi:hypothetical protein